VVDRKDFLKLCEEMLDRAQQQKSQLQHALQMG
jgi:hypothetical protein